MHKECKRFIKQVKARFPEKFRFKKVLEIGSMYINGTVRKHFWFCNFTGLDLAEGKCVDAVSHGADWRCDNYYDVVISCEAMEHDQRWRESLARMYNNLRPGGLLIVTCASTDRAEHGTRRSLPKDSPCTNDYYGNLDMKDFTSVLPHSYFQDYKLEIRRKGLDLVFWGVKKNNGNAETSYDYSFKGRAISMLQKELSAS
jgi:hypothetical protein